MQSIHIDRRFLKSIGAFFLSLFLVMGCWSAPGITQEPTQAAVTVDGQPIFQVTGSGEFTARERADLVNLQLKAAVESNQAAQIRVEQRNHQPTILLNDRYLLTVTRGDTAPNTDPNDQAQRWVQQLQVAITRSQAERAPGYLQTMGILAVLLLLAALGLSWLLGWAVDRLLQTIQRRLPDTASAASGSTASTGLELFLKLMLVAARTALWVTIVLRIADLFPSTRRWSNQATSVLLSSFTAPVLTLDRNSYSLLDLLVLGALLCALVIGSRILTHFLKSRLLSATGINRGAQEAIAILIRYTLMTIGALVLLQIWGLNISSLTILASALGIGIGFGLQDIAKNFVSGLVLVFERPIQVGDFIEVGELHGTVERIGARSTEIRTLDHVSIIVPNSRFLQQEVINWSHRNPTSRLHLPVGVSYDADPALIRSVLLEAAQHQPGVLQTPAPQVFFKGFGDSALNFELLVWIAEPNRQFVISSDLYFRIFEVLRERRVEIPFPQRDLHLRSGSLTLSPHIESALLRLSSQFPDGFSPQYPER